VCKKKHIKDGQKRPQPIENTRSENADLPPFHDVDENKWVKLFFHDVYENKRSYSE
jgi:hypothetical protein